MRRERDGHFRACFTMLGVARDEDRFEPEIFAELDIGEGVADDDAGFRGDLRKFGFGLLVKAGTGFAAGALTFVVGAEVEGVDPGAGFTKGFLKRMMNGINVLRGIQTESDAALIGHNDYAEAGLVELGDGFRDAGKQIEMLPGSDVLAFRHLAIQDAVAVEEDGTQRVFGLLDVHPVMIAIS